mmetsp:Transcript_49323/g.84783  ORF Transcript_49323/g.84783 Transcript_49323/m.84783 type:complete len:212 (-) Transcript_49323:845-1480(-)
MGVVGLLEVPAQGQVPQQRPHQPGGRGQIRAVQAALQHGRRRVVRGRAVLLLLRALGGEHLEEALERVRGPRVEERAAPPAGRPAPVGRALPHLRVFFPQRPDDTGQESRHVGRGGPRATIFQRRNGHAVCERASTDGSMVLWKYLLYYITKVFMKIFKYVLLEHFQESSRTLKNRGQNILFPGLSLLKRIFIIIFSSISLKGLRTAVGAC